MADIKISNPEAAADLTELEPGSTAMLHLTIDDVAEDGTITATIDECECGEMGEEEDSEPGVAVIALGAKKA